jgi:peptidoglycan/LPS O-acetylase OafA/YrhL
MTAVSRRPGADGLDVGGTIRRAMPDLRDSAASPFLDLVRLIAAQAVCFGHAISFFHVAPWLQPPYAPYMQNVAVQVFFVLSGFLIAYTLNRARTFGVYAIDRFARIYSAYLPCLFVVAALLALAGRDVSATTLAGNLFMLQNWPGPTVLAALAVPALDGPWWTIAVEWHIYFFVGALYFLHRAPLLAPVAVAFAFVPLAFLFGDAQLGVGKGLFALWLLGYAAYFLLPLYRGSIAVACAAFGAYLLLLTPGKEYERALYVPLAIAFYSAVAYAARLSARRSAWTRAIRFGAAYSFTLYLVHHALLVVWREIASGWWGALSGFAAANLVALAIAWPTEMRHRELARYIRAKFSRAHLV